LALTGLLEIEQYTLLEELLTFETSYTFRPLTSVIQRWWSAAKI
jgi:hypothetical protein